MDINKILSLKTYNKTLYNKLINKILSKETIYIATNEMNNITNPVVIPVANTDVVCIQLFDSFEMANEYRTSNPIEFTEAKLNDLLLLLDKLFFKGVTGVLYFSNEENKEVVTSYLHIEDILKDNQLINKENKELVKILNNVLLNKKYFNYLHHKSLTADEILYCIVHFNVHVEGSKKYINIFETEELAEEYCLKKGCYGLNKNEYPITTIVNSVLYHAISKLEDKVDFIIIYTKDKKYKINLKEFIYLIINVGFEQLHLD